MGANIANHWYIISGTVIRLPFKVIHIIDKNIMDNISNLIDIE